MRFSKFQPEQILASWTMNAECFYIKKRLILPLLLYIQEVFKYFLSPTVYKQFNIDGETLETIPANRSPWSRTIIGGGGGVRLLCPTVNVKELSVGPDFASRVYHPHSSVAFAHESTIRESAGPSQPSPSLDAKRNKRMRAGAGDDKYFGYRCLKKLVNKTKTMNF